VKVKVIAKITGELEKFLSLELQKKATVEKSTFLMTVLPTLLRIIASLMKLHVHKSNSFIVSTLIHLITAMLKPTSMKTREKKQQLNATTNILYFQYKAL